MSELTEAQQSAVRAIALAPHEERGRMTGDLRAYEKVMGLEHAFDINARKFAEEAAEYERVRDAAPALLEALEQFVSFYNDDGHDLSGFQSLNECLTKTRAAIALAKGGE